MEQEQRDLALRSLVTRKNAEQWDAESEQWMFLCDLIESENVIATDSRVEWLEAQLEALIAGAA